MSIATQIVCDGCGKSVSCGSGRDRKHAHAARTELAASGWSISGAPDGDLCAGCRTPRRKTGTGATKSEADQVPLASTTGAE